MAALWAASGTLYVAVAVPATGLSPLEHARQVLAAMPYIAAVVVVLGVPLALVVDRFCRLRRWGPGSVVAAFAVLGVLAGLLLWAVLGRDPLFMWPAVVAAPAGRAAAESLARRRWVLAVLTAAPVAISAMPLAG
ncbi:hypothetical protein A8924_6067 [Saccharopolyspora erythraea NRRL 2338]|uniref:Integral membrane protein n=1 Tax=Saccharopolyspora erythraea TaxID=1836 RepID=A0ABN1C4Z6_SACER|nr:hypothetical protein [Saccharopolyspora erythraea]PFG98550.1 hypothetical protein A8924_6067 [Saccharopolyspora erythraea NRRL 2338]